MPAGPTRMQRLWPATRVRSEQGSWPDAPDVIEPSTSALRDQLLSPTTVDLQHIPITAGRASPDHTRALTSGVPLPIPGFRLGQVPPRCCLRQFSALLWGDSWRQLTKLRVPQERHLVL
jgi:hypothetical protein